MLLTTSEAGGPGATGLQALGQGTGGVQPISTLQVDEYGLYDGDRFEAQT